MHDNATKHFFSSEGLFVEYVLNRFKCRKQERDVVDPNPTPHVEGGVGGTHRTPRDTAGDPRHLREASGARNDVQEVLQISSEGYGGRTFPIGMRATLPPATWIHLSLPHEMGKDDGSEFADSPEACAPRSREGVNSPEGKQ